MNELANRWINGGVGLCSTTMVSSLLLYKS